MIVYNVTVKIDTSCESEWLNWMQTVHIPEVMDTGCFNASKVMRLLDPPSDESGTTYAIQYTCEHMEILKKYWEDFAPQLQAKHIDRYKDRFVAFRTVMELVE